MKEATKPWASARRLILILTSISRHALASGSSSVNSERSERNALLDRPATRNGVSHNRPIHQPPPQRRRNRQTASLHCKNQQREAQCQI